MDNERAVEIELVCADLPRDHLAANPELRLGIQQKREVVDDVSVAEAVAAGGHVVFRFSLRVRGTPGEDAPNFLGAHAQGTPASRFVYLCWGTRAHDEWIPQRRAKVPLGGITWEEIEAALAAEQPIRATISCTNNKGEPVAASLKPDMCSWSVMGDA